MHEPFLLNWQPRPHPVVVSPRNNYILCKEILPFVNLESSIFQWISSASNIIEKRSKFIPVHDLLDLIYLKSTVGLVRKKKESVSAEVKCNSCLRDLLSW